jgi:ribosome-associated protein
MIEIMANLSIAEEELKFSSSRSSGPGGQNVNKVNTRITLWFDVNNSAALAEAQKAIVLDKLKNRINKEGLLWVNSHRSRSQLANRQEAILRFAELLQRALTPEPVRKKTKLSFAAKAKRLALKKKRSEVKNERRKNISLFFLFLFC